MILTIFKLATWGGGLLQLWWTLFTSLILKMIFFCLLSIFFGNTHTHLFFVHQVTVLGPRVIWKKNEKFKVKKKIFDKLIFPRKFFSTLSGSYRARRPRLSLSRVELAVGGGSAAGVVHRRGRFKWSSGILRSVGVHGPCLTWHRERGSNTQ